MVRREEDRASAGVMWFSSVTFALQWYFNQRESWESPRAIPLSSLDDGSGAPSRGADSRSRKTFGLIGPAIAIVERAERRKPGGAPIGSWLAQHYVQGRTYERISEWTDGRWTHHQVERRMVAAHRLIAERLARSGLIPGKAE